MSSSYPYATTHDVVRGMPSEGRARDSSVGDLPEWITTSGAASHSRNERNREQNQENKEQDSGDAGGRSSDAKKAKNGSNKSDNEKCQCPAQHRSSCAERLSTDYA